MRRAARTDANHATVVQALRSLGYWVWDTSPVGRGFPDLLTARRGLLELVEVKDGAKVPSRRRLTADEARVHQELAAYGVTVRVVTGVEDLLGPAEAGDADGRL